MQQDIALLNFGKIVIGTLWVATGSAVLLPGDSALFEAGRLIFWITAAAHVVECAIFFPTLNGRNEEDGRSLGENILLTLIFGVVHYATLKREEAIEQAG